MMDYLLEVVLALDVKQVPQIAADDYTSKSEVFCYLYIVNRHSSEGVDTFAYESLLCCFLELFEVECRFLVGELDAVEDVFKEDIVALLPQCLEQIEVGTRTA